ncbi:MAG: phrA [Thermoleophilia bacterium]|nr:phrA [Thermoleophilia bacterium]
MPKAATAGQGRIRGSERSNTSRSGGRANLSVMDPETTTSLCTPWTHARQQRAVAVLAGIDADACAPERLLAWNDVATHAADGRSVVYWMARAQRGSHNLALDCAVAAARALDLPLVVVFRRFAGPAGTELRHVEFMLRALPETFDDCIARGAHVLFVEQDGVPIVELLARDGALRPALVITDDDVMAGARRGREHVANSISAPLISVDADVVVPGACFPRQEYAARTLRPRLHRVLAQFDGELGHGLDGPTAPAHPVPAAALQLAGVHLAPAIPALDDLLAHARAAGTPDGASLLTSAPSGTRAARARLEAFVNEELHGYAARRNRPELDGTSHISPFVHFGQVAPHEVLATVRAAEAPAVDIDTFVEEFVVRRELAYNFVRWNPHAHELEGAPEWARRSLATHAADPREWLWNEDDLAAGTTHDPLWNAAQHQMVETGSMHGYLRMYWAKKLLEWRPDAAGAFELALRFNDRWSLDGRDPNGVTGVAWAIGGVHDRPWHEREIFGQVRFMSLASTGRKFDSKAYIARWNGANGAAVPGRGISLF